MITFVEFKFLPCLFGCILLSLKQHIYFHCVMKSVVGYSFAERLSYLNFIIKK